MKASTRLLRLLAPLLLTACAAGALKVGDTICPNDCPGGLSVYNWREEHRFGDDAPAGLKGVQVFTHEAPPGTGQVYAYVRYEARNKYRVEAVKYWSDYQADLTAEQAPALERRANAEAEAKVKAAETAAVAKPIIDMLERDRVALVAQRKREAKSEAAALASRCEQLGNVELPVNQVKFQTAVQMMTIYELATGLDQATVAAGFKTASQKDEQRRRALEEIIAGKLQKGLAPDEVAKSIVEDELLMKEFRYLTSGSDPRGRRINRPLTIEETPIAFTLLVECD